MNEIVKIIHNDIFTNSWIVSELTGNTHQAVAKLINKYCEDFETFGELTDYSKSINESGTRHAKVFYLNEPQATLLMTFLGNSEMVRKFKLELVKQFYTMRQILLEHQSLHWQQTRIESKTNRKLETDEIKEFIQYAKDNGSQNADKYYIHFSKLANKTVGLDADSRDIATVSKLNNLILVENIINNCIREGIRQQGYYKDIFKVCKARLEQFREIAYLKAA